MIAVKKIFKSEKAENNSCPVCEIKFKTKIEVQKHFKIHPDKETIRELIKKAENKAEITKKVTNVSKAQIHEKSEAKQSVYDPLEYKNVISVAYKCNNCDFITEEISDMANHHIDTHINNN